MINLTNHTVRNEGHIGSNFISPENVMNIACTGQESNKTERKKFVPLESAKRKTLV